MKRTGWTRKALPRLLQSRVDFLGSSGRIDPNSQLRQFDLRIPRRLVEARSYWPLSQAAHSVLGDENFKTAAVCIPEHVFVILNINCFQVVQKSFQRFRVV